MTGTALSEITARLVDNGISFELIGDERTVVDDAFHDHRQVRPGGLFCCVVGSRFDGHAMAAEAIRAGAGALLSERRLDVDVPQIIVPVVRTAMGPVAARIHGDPSTRLCCVGITGTNGKTTTAALMGSVLRADGRSVEVIGTLTGVRTTPEATDLQRDLADLEERGRSAVVMEVSSHALAQHRVDGMHYDMAVFTNLSRDHLDFHGTMEEYFRAKARLFEPVLSARGVVNTDDAHGLLLRDASQIPVEGYGFVDAEPVRGFDPIDFTWRGKGVSSTLAGRFNIENALAAATAARGLGIDDKTIRAGLSDASSVPGRFEMIRMGQNFGVVVDFAHTPDGLSKALGAARELAGDRRVVLVFGAGGDRDATKRPLMGAAADAADVVVITNDNPRSEPPADIAEQIRAGLAKPDGVEVELDRRAAMARALEAAKPGDVVLIAGKGHETTQTIGARVQHFDDREVVRELLTERGYTR